MSYHELEAEVMRVRGLLAAALEENARLKAAEVDRGKVCWPRINTFKHEALNAIEPYFNCLPESGYTWHTIECNIERGGAVHGAPSIELRISGAGETVSMFARAYPTGMVALAPNAAKG